MYNKRVTNVLLTCLKDIDHAQGPGQLVHQPCEVTFDIIIPQNLEETPYYLFHSQGVHTHAPPPPHKTPEQLTKEIINLIHQINDPGLTTGILYPYYIRNVFLTS